MHSQNFLKMFIFWQTDESLNKPQQMSKKVEQCLSNYFNKKVEKNWEASESRQFLKNVLEKLQFLLKQHLLWTIDYADFST